MRWCLLVVVVVFLATAAPAYAAVDANPGSLSFAQDVGDGPSAAQSSVVTNNTALPVPLSVTDPAKPEFQLLKDDPVGDCSQRHGLFPGDSCRVRVRFDPSADGTITDAVVVNDGTDDTPIQLSGTGTMRQLTPSPASIAF